MPSLLAALSLFELAAGLQRTAPPGVSQVVLHLSDVVHPEPGSLSQHTGCPELALPLASQLPAPPVSPLRSVHPATDAGSALIGQKNIYLKAGIKWLVQKVLEGQQVHSPDAMETSELSDGSSSSSFSSMWDGGRSLSSSSKAWLSRVATSARS